jgi:chromosome segregation ATPase
MIRFIRRWFDGTKAGLLLEIDRLKVENEENCKVANKQIQRQHRENQVMCDENARLYKENMQKGAAIRGLVEQVEQGRKDHVQHAYELLRNISLRENELRPGGHDANCAENKIEDLEEKIQNLKAVVDARDSCIQRQHVHIVRLKKEAEEQQTTRRLLLDGHSDGEGVREYEMLRSKLNQAERSLEKCRKVMEWSTSRVCLELHFQNCQVCERMECCDNANPVKAALVDAAKKVGMLKVRLANCDYYAESALSLGDLDQSAKQYLLNIRTEAGIGADDKQATNFRTGEVYEGPVTFKGLPLEWELNP